MQSLPFELNYRIALDLPFDDTIKYCQSNSQLLNICSDEAFWKRKARFNYKQSLPACSASKQYKKLEKKNLKLLPPITPSQLDILFILIEFIPNLIDSIGPIDPQYIIDTLSRYPNHFRSLTDSTDPDEIISAIIKAFYEPLIESHLVVLKIKSNFILEDEEETPLINQKIVVRNHESYLSPYDILSELIKHINHAPTEFDISDGGYQSGIPVIKFVLAY